MKYNTSPQIKNAYWGRLRTITLASLIISVILALLIIIEAAMPGELSAKQSNFLSDILTSLRKENSASTPPELTDVELSDMYGFAGESEPVSLRCYPGGATKTSLTFTSSDEDVATVSDDGTVFFHRYGKAEITAFSNANKDIYSTAKITCYGSNPRFISQIRTENYVFRQGTRSLLRLYDQNGERVDASVFDIVSDDESVLRFSDSSVIAIKGGLAAVTFSHPQSGFSQRIAFSVDDDSSFGVPQSFAFSTSEITLQCGDEFDLDELLTDVTPKGANTLYDIVCTPLENDGILEWTTANRYMAIRSGKMKITISSCFNQACAATLIVNVEEPKPTRLRIVRSDTSFVIGNKYTLHAYNGYDYSKKVKWQIISGNAVVSENGVITSNRLGKVVIRVTSLLNPSVSADMEVEFVLFKNFKTFVRAFFGHFMLFTLFGIFLSTFLFLVSKPRGSYPISGVIIGLALAVISELLQLPSVNTGRGASIRDVLTDLIGLVLGIVITSTILLLYTLIKKKTAANNFRLLQDVLSGLRIDTVFKRTAKHIIVYSDVYVRQKLD